MNQGDIFQTEERPTPRVNAIIGGKYRLLRKICEGGGGIVWEACDPKFNALALKFLRWSHTRTQKDQADRFKNEFAILKSLSHPNIAEIYDFGHDPETGLYFFTSELLTAGTLKDMMDEPIPVMEALLLQALRALEYLRGNKLLHLDVKPQNLLLRRDGANPVLALIDFGLATFRPPDIPGGTASYMPPEVIVRRLDEKDECWNYPPPDHRSDLYSLGVTFYQCLTGILPFAVSSSVGGALDTLAIMRRHLEHDPPPPSSIRREIPAYLDHIIMKLMARHPDDRHPSAIVAAQALQYRSAHRHAPESTQTLLAWLPKEGRLVGRRKERAIVEQVVKDISDGKRHAAPAVCISGRHGAGRTRLLKSIKPFAQQLDMDVTYVDKIIDWNISASHATHLILIDDLDRHISSDEGNGTAEASKASLAALARRLRLQQRLGNAPRPHIGLIFTVNSDRTDPRQVLTDLNLDETVCHSLVLKNFSHAEVAEYLEAVLGEKPDDAVVEQLKRCTDGNPLFITEHIEEMIAKGRLFSLAGRPDQKTLKTIGIDFSKAEPSKSLSADIAEKMKMLGPDALDLTLALACWQRPASVSELVAVANLKDPERGVPILVSSGFVDKMEDGRLAFANTLASKVIRERTGKKKLAAFHDSIAAYLKRSGKRKNGEMDLHLGYGSRDEERMPALDRLAKAAMERREPADSAEHLEELLKLVPDERFEEKGSFLERLGQAYERARRFDDAKGSYSRMKRIKAPGDEHLQLAVRAEEQLGLLALRRREHVEARRHFMEAMKNLKNRKDMLPMRLKIENLLASLEMRNGQFEEAARHFERTLAMAEKVLPKAARRLVTGNELGEALLRAGHPRRAIKILSGELKAASASDDTERTARYNYLLGEAFRHNEIKDYKAADLHYQAALKVARSGRMVEIEVRVRNGLGNLNLKLENPSKALEQYRAALGLAQQTEGETTSVELMIGMGLAAQRLARPDDTIECFEAALDFSRGPRARQAGLLRRYQPNIYVSLGDAYYHKHDLKHAEEYLKEALLIDKKRTLPLETRYSLYGTFAEIAIERGDAAAAKKHLPVLTAIVKAFPPARPHLAELEKKIEAIRSRAL